MPRPIFSHPMVFREPRGTGAAPGPSTGGGATISPTPPPSPAVGEFWWRTTDGVLYVWYDDGTSQQWVPASPPGVAGPRYYLLAGSQPGILTASLALGAYVSTLAFTLPAGLPGSQAKAKVAATGATSLDVQVNAVSKGSITWGAGATVATFTWASPVSIAIGDRIDIYAPATADATLSDPVWTLQGNI